MLSYLSKWKASTTNLHSLPVGSKLLSYLSKWKVSTTPKADAVSQWVFVVIPLQMKGFYNFSDRVRSDFGSKSCHTSPNERLLQLGLSMPKFKVNELSYLSKWKASTTIDGNCYCSFVCCCHTSPNERLLQHYIIQCFTTALKFLIARISVISKD